MTNLSTVACISHDREESIEDLRLADFREERLGFTKQAVGGNHPLNHRKVGIADIRAGLAILDYESGLSR